MGIGEKGQSQWPVTTKRFVSYIDIMGFKDLVWRSSHEEIYDMMKDIKQQLAFSSSINWNETPETLVNVTTYSDSIIIYSKDDSKDSRDSIINTLACALGYLLRKCIPYKGAIAFGEMTLDLENSIFFGKPLIDAYLLQEEALLYGMIMHGSCEGEILKNKDLHTFFMNYLCPFKNGTAEHIVMYPIELLDYEGSSVSPEGIKRYKLQKDNLYDALKDMKYHTSGALRKYIDNTKSFFKAVEEARSIWFKN